MQTQNIGAPLHRKPASGNLIKGPLSGAEPYKHIGQRLRLGGTLFDSTRRALFHIPTNTISSHEIPPFAASTKHQVHIIPPELAPAPSHELHPRTGLATQEYPSLSRRSEPPTKAPLTTFVTNKTKTCKPPQSPLPSKPYISSHDEANAALHKTLQERVEQLPNATNIHDNVGKSSNPKIGLMQPSAQALQHPAADLLDTYAT